MSAHPPEPARAPARRPYRSLLSGAALVAAVAVATVAARPVAAQQARGNQANWALANKFTPEAMRPILYSETVAAHWIGKSDSMWYNWKDHTGSTFYLAVPALKLKRPLFDHARLAAALTAQSGHAYDAYNLPFTSVEFGKDHRTFGFNADSSHWEWNLAAETLTRTGAATRERPAPAGRGGRGFGGFGFGGGDFRNYSPDSTHFVFARNFNLFIVDTATKDTTQISFDGERKRSFGYRDTAMTQLNERGRAGGAGRGGANGGEDPLDPRVRANVVWSRDSKAFAVLRQDQRKVGDLYLIDELAQPRPTFMEYPYAMPGETNVAIDELYTYQVGDKQVTPLDVGKYKDQRIMDLVWPDAGHDVLSLVRRDRTQRALEMIDVDLRTHDVRTILTEKSGWGGLQTQEPWYVKAGGDFIWWSDSTGWGHYYLYSHDGKLLGALGTGPWRAEELVDVDSVRRVAWMTGVGREPGEDPYYHHLYRVNLDGTGLTLVDAGDATHSADLSPSDRYDVDNGSRIDQAPHAVIRDAATGATVMDLETMDVSGLKALGWKPPEPFRTKAADGITDIWGEMWKPFDFDSTRSYPIITYTYPGPQTESVVFNFSPTAQQQQLAQLGFIVVTFGNRGGSPERSRAYDTFGYLNLRDYGLADKKYVIQELADEHKYIDINRVGIYGHSGGGFQTAAAMLLPPYNEFFKVGVSESGNHDNNIYNQNWSEQYHGLQVELPGDTTRGRGGRGGGGGGGGGRGGRGGGAGAGGVNIN
ncbi:MAG: DPP IV N-terminal domain-containing protein, partial [Gemmatimonadota bacterium]|nr:DPP IV N-terminal domain-containing protein [Gemmatimonadota bacterium]